jgi:hypothetical protein
MSKTSETSLTPSRKTRLRQLRQARRQARSRRIDAFDEINVRCQRALALAGLLEACGKHPQAEPLEAAMVTEVGFLILVEVRAMAALLKTVWQELPR